MWCIIERSARDLFNVSDIRVVAPVGFFYVTLCHLFYSNTSTYRPIYSCANSQHYHKYKIKRNVHNTLLILYNQYNKYVNLHLMATEILFSSVSAVRVITLHKSIKSVSQGYFCPFAHSTFSKTTSDKVSLYNTQRAVTIKTFPIFFSSVTAKYH